MTRVKLRGFRAIDRPNVGRSRGDEEPNDWKLSRGQRWNLMWIDVWNPIYSDNLGAMRALRRRYARRASWVGVWAYHATLRAAALGR
jgi:hypothetical protein